MAKMMLSQKFHLYFHFYLKHKTEVITYELRYFISITSFEKKFLQIQKRCFNSGRDQKGKPKNGDHDSKVGSQRFHKRVIQLFPVPSEIHVYVIQVDKVYTVGQST